VASSSSSTKKAAKLAQKGKGRKVRFQGGTVFPAAVAMTLILGFALIVYSRQSVPAADSTPPTIDDHWHAAYGFYLCDTWYELQGNLEELTASGQFANQEFLRTGVHSHDDGVIHWHPFGSPAVGENAVLGVFLDTYDVELENDVLTFPENNRLGFAEDGEYVEGETKCNGEDAELSVRAWGSFTDTDSGKRYIANMDRIHIDNDGMVFGIYFTPQDADQPMPPKAQQLPELGAVDSGQVTPDELVPDTTVPGGSTPESVEPNSAAVDSTVPSSTAPPTTTG
jgi:hypothetical protein